MPTDKIDAGQSPSFRNPPVIEVSIGVQFSRLQKWQTRHFGEFWSALKGDYPNTQDAPPVDAVGTSRFEILLLPPLRRVFFISENSNFLVQVQDARLHVNWRKVRPDDVYPRFPHIYPEFVKVFDRFAEFVKERGIGEMVPDRYELTYVNHIDASGADFASSLENNVKLFNWSRVQPRHLTAPLSAAASWHFKMQNEMGDMTANLTHVKTVEAREVLVLALVCAGSPSPGIRMQDWYKAAHDSIVYGFADLTTEIAHKRWGREQ